MTETIRAIITGRVQGVSYRAWTVTTARRHNLSGWVRNRREGTVEAVFSGEPHAVKTMLDACRKGPLLARVTAIETFPHEERIDDAVFLTLPTE